MSKQNQTLHFCLYICQDANRLPPGGLEPCTPIQNQWIQYRIVDNFIFTKMCVSYFVNIINCSNTWMLFSFLSARKCLVPERSTSAQRHHVCKAFRITRKINLPNRPSAQKLLTGVNNHFRDRLQSKCTEPPETFYERLGQAAFLV